MKAGFRRIVEVARCCGRKYFKSRLLGRDFPGTHHEVCVHCRQPLIYTRPNLRVTKNALQQRARAGLVQQGLTTKGAVPQRRFRYELKGLHGSARHTAYMKLQRAERKQAGLTARGSTPVLPRRAPTPQMETFAALKAEIDGQPNVVPLYQGFADRPVKMTVPTANAQGFMKNLITRRVA